MTKSENLLASLNESKLINLMRMCVVGIILCLERVSQANDEVINKYKSGLVEFAALCNLGLEQIF